MKKRPHIIMRPTLKRLAASRRVALRKAATSKAGSPSEKSAFDRIEKIDAYTDKLTAPKL